MDKEILKMVIGNNILGQKQLFIVTEDGMIYRIPCERLDQLTDEAFKNLKSSGTIQGNIGG